MNQVRSDLPPLPDRCKALPVDPRGYPIPWFVYMNEDGTPEFRIADNKKRGLAVRERRCWVCGGKMGRYLAFVIGPMCSVNRATAEPPCHRECAIWSAIACPFLSRPHMRRREDSLPEEMTVPGEMITRNPGATCIWITTSYSIMRVSNGDLFEIGDPTETLWYAEGRTATRDEVLRSIDTGLPALREVEAKNGPDAMRDLDVKLERAQQYLPA